MSFVTPMESSNADPKVIAAILLSDNAIREMGTGKLTLVGLFGAWNCPAFPYNTPPFWITVSLTNFPAGTKSANVVVRLEQKQTGLVVGNTAAQIGFPDGKITLNSIIDLPLIMPGVVLPQPGTYRVVVLANDEKLDERAIEVNLASPPPVAPQFPPH